MTNHMKLSTLRADPKVFVKRNSSTKLWRFACCFCRSRRFSFYIFQVHLVLDQRWWRKKEARCECSDFFDFDVCRVHLYWSKSVKREVLERKTCFWRKEVLRISVMAFCGNLFWKISVCFEGGKCQWCHFIFTWKLINEVIDNFNQTSCHFLEIFSSDITWQCSQQSPH